MSGKHHMFLAAMAAALLACGARGQPTGWRFDGTGLFPDARPPLTWSAESNVVWKTALPGKSNASPVLSGDRLFVCSEPSTLVCVSAKDGRILWQKDCEIPEQKPPTHEVNGYASATPVTDGRRVFVVFGTGVVACFDTDGKQLWSRLVEAPSHPYGWGHCASPLLSGKTLVVYFNRCWALNADDGNTLWQAESRREPFVFGSDVHARVGKTEAVITPSGDIFRVADGKALASRVASVEFSSPIVDGDIVYFIQNGGAAVRLTPEGDGVKAERLWTTWPPKERYYASPVLHEGLIYGVQLYSLLSVLDAADGKVIYSRKLGLDGLTYSSICVAGRYLYISGEKGDTVVMEPGREYKEVARNRLEPFKSTPLFSGRRMYVRGETHLYCIGAP